MLRNVANLRLSVRLEDTKILTDIMVPYNYKLVLLSNVLSKIATEFHSKYSILYYTTWR